MLLGSVSAMLLATGCASPQSGALQQVVRPAVAGPAWVAATVSPGAMIGGMVIEEVVFERDGDGDPRGLRVLVRRDGHVEHTRVGHPRRGTADETHAAQLAPQAFDALVDLLHRQGFFALQAVYDDGQLADGPWALVRVVHQHDGVRGEQQVWWREGHAPEALQAVEAALRTLGASAVPGAPAAVTPTPSTRSPLAPGPR